MRYTRSLLALVIVPLGAACSSQTYPASPVPAALLPEHAVVLADQYLAGQDDDVTTQAAAEVMLVEPRLVTKIERTGWGYLVGYKTVFDPMRTTPDTRGDADAAPRDSRLIAVQHDGDVREWTFRRGR